MGQNDSTGRRHRSCKADLKRILVLSNILGLVASFTSHSHVTAVRRVNLNSMAGESDFLNKVNFFAKEVPSRESLSTPPATNAESFDPVADALIGKSKAVIASDLGIQNPSLLAEDFLWIGPNLEKPLGKVDYLAAGRFFSLRTAFPDLDYRPHDFRIDRNDPLTVRCTVRPVGVMRGPLRLRNELLQPNGKQWRGPPEAISLTFDSDSGKVAKMCSGFAMDRLVGNTNGLCGVMAAATIAGEPPSDWEVYPIPAVITKFFGRPVDPIAEVSTFLAPFPETVMIQLVKGILTTKLAAEDPALLAKDFTYITPSVGPIGKGKFLESYAAQEFGGFEPEYSHFRVDPFDPYRVWVDVKPVGPGLEGPPQAFSFTFDDDGFCTRITAGAVMDPSIGNTGGLTGPAGIKYASGEGDLDFAVRPLPVVIGRLKKTILSPFTKISADEYVLESQQLTTNNDNADLKSVESRKALAMARAQMQEEEAKKKQMIAEAEARLRALQEAEEEKLRAQRETQQQAEEELKKLRQEMEQQVSKRETEIRQESQPAETVEKKEFKLPTPPKVLPPNELVSKVAPLPKSSTNSRKEQSPPKTDSPKESQTNFLSEAFKPLANVSMPKPPSFGDILPKIDRTEEDESEKQKKATADARRREQAKLEQQSAAAAKQKAAFEEERKKRLEEQKLAAEQKRIDLEKRKAAAAEALTKKNTAIYAAIAKRKEEDEKKRQEADKKRQEAILKGKDALAGALSNFQSQPYPMAPSKLQEPKKPSKKSSTRPSLQIRLGKAEPESESKAQAPLPRPSFQIPQFSKADKNTAPQTPRPSIPIPPKVKSLEKSKSGQEAKAAPRQPRPSLQLPQLLNISPKAEPTSALSRAKPSKPTPKTTSPRQSLQISKATKAPKGISTLVNWRKLSDGGVSGQIFGSVNFKDGERIETSSIATGQFENGSIVTTASGSKYFLSGETASEMRAATDSTQQRRPDTTKGIQRTTLPLSKLAKERDEKSVQASLGSTSKAPTVSNQRRPTFSLSEFFGVDKSSDMGTQPEGKTAENPPKSRSPLTKQAPKGVPSIKRWKQNTDKSITGFISGSSSFSDGEKITTSPISRGSIESGKVVTTSSGTKYFLQ